MNLDQIKSRMPNTDIRPTHYCPEQDIFIHIDNGTWYFDDVWIQYDKPHNLKLVEI